MLENIFTPPLKYYKVYPSAKDPVFATRSSACFDLFCHWEKGQKVIYYSPDNVQVAIEQLDDILYIRPGFRVLVPTGLILDIPCDYSVRIHPRSGLALKNGLILGNCEGVIDDDYYHEAFIMVLNVSNIAMCISNNTRVAQGEMVPRLTYSLEETFLKPEQKTNRVGGLGSTGVQ